MKYEALFSQKNDTFKNSILECLLLLLRLALSGLTLKALSKIVADDILILFNYYFSEKNNAWHFMGIVY